MGRALLLLLALGGTSREVREEEGLRMEREGRREAIVGIAAAVEG